MQVTIREAAKRLKYSPAYIAQRIRKAEMQHVGWRDTATMKAKLYELEALSELIGDQVSTKTKCVRCGKLDYGNDAELRHGLCWSCWGKELAGREQK